VTADPFMNEHQCEHCGRKFTSKRKDARFCPDEPGRHCRIDAHRAKDRKKLDKKIRKPCDLCGKSYWTDLPSRSMYCSRKCAYRAAYLRRPEGDS
jgi:hypothetical protein